MIRKRFLFEDSSVILAWQMRTLEFTGGLLFLLLGGILMWICFGSYGAGLAGWMLSASVVNSGFFNIALGMGCFFVVIGLIVMALAFHEVEPKQVTPTPTVKAPTSCIKCGAELPVASEFCNKCGAKQG